MMLLALRIAKSIGSTILPFALGIAFSVTAASASVELPVFKLNLAKYVAGNSLLATYYQDRDFEPIWTGTGEIFRQRRVEFLKALGKSSGHGLPDGRYAASELIDALRSIATEGQRAKAEAEMSRAYLAYATSLHSGIVDPSKASEGIARKRRVPSAEFFLNGIQADNPAGFLAGLAPQSPDYVALRKEIVRLDRIIAQGGWGPRVSASELKPGQSGQEVVELRNRLIAMGYMNRSAIAKYGTEIQFAVQRFQRDHGLDADGVADNLTLKVINADPETRRSQVIASLERLRWMNFPLGDRHVLVNIANYQADIFFGGENVFSTRVVVGKTDKRLQTPEFSDTMTHMVINPTWNVPRSIATLEVLPMLQEDPGSEPQLVIFHPETGPIDRQETDFTQFSAKDFPFEMRQPPGIGNALGQVKFMFPNRHSVYMHDTPSKGLFLREERAFSHGCIRVQRAFDLAEFLLSEQVSNPGYEFAGKIATGRETWVNLQKWLSVHVTYLTAWAQPGGRIQYREDIYGRDLAIYAALNDLGVDREHLGS